MTVLREQQCADVLMPQTLCGGPARAADGRGNARPAADPAATAARIAGAGDLGVTRISPATVGSLRPVLLSAQRLRSAVTGVKTPCRPSAGGN